MGLVLGVEIGNSNIKLAVCNGGKVKKLICEKLPDGMMRDGRVTVPDVLSDMIKRLCRENGVYATRVKMVLPEQSVFTKTVTMPIMSDAELRLNLPYEFKDYMNDAKNKADYAYDYVVLGVTEAKADQPGELKIFAAAVNLSFVDDYKAVFKKAGLKLVGGVPREMALQNLVRNSENAPKELVIVDVGHTKTNVDVFKDGLFSMGKKLDVGGEMITSVIMNEAKVDEHTARMHKETNLGTILSNENCIDVYNQIALDVIKVINFYEYSTHSDGLRDLYFTGGTTRIEMLRTKLVKGTELSPHLIGKLYDSTEELTNTEICALAVGAGVQPDKEPKPAKTKEATDGVAVNG